jgi:hypothetical protein
MARPSSFDVELTPEEDPAYAEFHWRQELSIREALDEEMAFQEMNQELLAESAVFDPLYEANRNLLPVHEV